MPRKPSLPALSDPRPFVLLSSIHIRESSVVVYTVVHDHALLERAGQETGMWHRESRERRRQRNTPQSASNLPESEDFIHFPHRRVATERNLRHADVPHVFADLLRMAECRCNLLKEFSDITSGCFRSAQSRCLHVEQRKTLLRRRAIWWLLVRSHQTSHCQNK